MTNITEANFALHLYKNLEREAGHFVTQSRICVITPYSQQALLLRRTFAKGIGNDYERNIEVNTIDSFQGREANVIIFSCVRAAGSHGIGFLSDVRRMNVALTRAKHYLFIIARCESIVINPYWDQLVTHARERHAIIQVPVPASSSKANHNSFPPLTKLKAMKPTPKEMVPISMKRLLQKPIEDKDSNEEDGEIALNPFTARVAAFKEKFA